MFGAFGVLLGLRQRDLTGQGCVIDVSMFDAMLALNEKAISMYGIGGEVPPPRISATTAPFGLYPTRDGWVCIAVGSDAVWRRFCVAVGAHIGRPDLAEDESLWVGTDRVSRLAEVTGIVEEFTRNRATGEVVDFLLEHDVPAGQPLEVDALLEARQVKERRVVRRLDLGVGVEVPVVMSPVVVSGAEQPVQKPHRLDEDRSRILREWLEDDKRVR